MFSYWEQQSLLQYDFIVIGAGTVGLHTAIELRALHPKSSILVVDRSVLPYGASTRNAGFACIGSLTELVSDCQTMSKEQMKHLVGRRKKGLERMRNRFGDEVIGYQSAGSHELLEEKDLVALEQLDSLNNLLADINQGQPVFSIADEKIAAFGFPTNRVKSLVANGAEGELHTGKMMWALKEFALHQGIEIKTGATVTQLEEGSRATAWVYDDVRQESIGLQCRQLFVCTNAFSKRLLPSSELQPGRGQVLLTEPIPQLKLKGIFHFDEGFYYFRELEGRILFGGGRNIDFSGETTENIGLNHAIQQQLEQYLHILILPGQQVKIAMRWAGIMAFGKDKQPIVQQVGKQTFGAFRMGGMGIALAPQVAVELVALALQSA